MQGSRNLKSPLSYTVSLATKLDRFSAVLSPQAGKNFAPYFSALKRALSGELSQTSPQFSGQLSGDCFQEPLESQSSPLKPLVLSISLPFFQANRQKIFGSRL